MLDDVFKHGYARVREEFQEEQASFIKVIAEARRMPEKWIVDAGGVFIPNNDFMLEMFGDEILQYDCYRNGQCLWENALVFPIKGVNGAVAGLAGFFPFDYVEHEPGAVYYAYSSSSVFKKGSYLFFPKHDLKSAIENRYLIVVDGIFDAISLCGVGYYAAAMMGSSLTQEIAMQLRFVDHVILAADNDSAGYKLYDEMRKKLHNVTLLKHAKTKDVDESIKSENATEFLRDLNGLLLKLGIVNQNEQSQLL